VEKFYSSVINKTSRYTRCLSWWNLVRWFSTIAFLSVGVLFMGVGGKAFPRSSFVLILIALNLLNLVYSFWLEDVHTFKIFPLIHNFLDVIIFSLAISMTGGLKSPLIWLYLIPIITASLTNGKIPGFLAGIFSTFCMIQITLQIKDFDFHTVAGITPVTKQEFLRQTPEMISFTCLFFLTYFITSYLSESLKRDSGDLICLNSLLSPNNSETPRTEETAQKIKKLAAIVRTGISFQDELLKPLAIISTNIERLMKDEQVKNTNGKFKELAEGILGLKTVLGKIERLYKDSAVVVQ